jgi:sulfur carrier protein ThiS
MTNTRAAVATLLAVVGLASAAGLRAEIIEQILVKVNGEIFTKSDLEQRQVSARRSTRLRRKSWSTRWTKCCWCSAAKSSVTS